MASNPETKVQTRPTPIQPNPPKHAQNPSEKEKQKKQGQPTNAPQYRAGSGEKLARKSILSAEKRVRLRDYLFVAKSSVEKNSEIMQQLKKSVPDKQTLAQSIEKIRKSKYSLSNKQIHAIVKKEVEKEMQNVITSMQQDLDFIRNLDLEHVANEDLVYLHEVRGILMYKVAPALKEINQISFKRQGNLFKQIISLGENLARQKSSKKNQPQSKEGRQPKSPTKAASGNEAQGSANVGKPGLVDSVNLFELLLGSKSSEI